MAKNKHLTLSDRIIIEKGLNNNSSRKSIELSFTIVSSPAVFI